MKSLALILMLAMSCLVSACAGMDKSVTQAHGFDDCKASTLNADVWCAESGQDIAAALPEMNFPSRMAGSRGIDTGRTE